MRTLAIANQKGGVGKTTTAHTLAVLLATTRRVLLCDLDPQASLTRTLNQSPTKSMADVLAGRAKIPDIVLPLSDRLDLAPGDIALASVELELVGKIGRENILKRALAGVSYDLCILDCPPSLSLITVNALAAADGVLIPVQPTAMDLRGLGLFMQTLETVREQLNPNLQVVGILVTFFDARLNHHQEALEAMKSAGLPVLSVKLGRSIRVAEAAGLGKTITEYEPSNPQAEAYIKLAKDIGKWQREKQP